MKKNFNFLFAALLLSLLFTGCQPEDKAPSNPYLSKIYNSNGVLSREYTYEGVRPMKETQYNTTSGQVSTTRAISYNASGKVSLIMVRSPLDATIEEDQTFIYDAGGKLTKIEYTAVNNARLRKSGEANLLPGEMFAYTAFEYNASQELIKTSDFQKYSTSPEDWPEVSNFGIPVSYMVYEYGADGNAAKKTLHNAIPHTADTFFEEYTYTYDTQKNPFFYSALFDEATPNPRIARNNTLTRRTVSNLPANNGQRIDFTFEYNAEGFPVKRTMVESGGRSGDRTVVHTYEYQMR